MRDLFVIIGSILIAVLLAAFAVPRLIDWAPYKAQIEAQIRERTGLKLMLAGPMRLEVLPRLALNAQDVAIDAEGATLTATRMRAELSMAALLGGVPHIVQAELDGAVVKLAKAADADPAGALISLLTPSGPPLQIDAMSLNTVAVKGAASDAPILLIEHGDVALAARAGPLRLTAEGVFGEVRGHARLGIGTPDEERHRHVTLGFDADANPAAEHWHLSFEGQITAADGARAILDGAAVLAQGKAGATRFAESENSEAPLWRAQAKARGELRNLRFDEIEISRQRAAALRLNGQGSLDLRGSLDLAKPRLTLDLSARRLALDPLIGGDASAGQPSPPGQSSAPGPRSVGIAAALAELAELAKASLPRALTAEIDIGAETVELADASFESVRLRALLRNQELVLTSLAAKWPGRGELSFTGGGAGGGHLEVKSADAAALLQGFGLAGDASAAPVRLVVSGNLSRRDAATHLDHLDVSLAGSKIGGALTIFDRGTDGKLRADAELTSQDLDLDSWSLGAVTGIVPAAVEGHLLVHVARLKAGRGAGEVGQLDMAISRADGRTLIDTLRLQGFEGLTLDGSGAIGGAGSSFAAHINAPKAAPLAGLARLVLPPSAVEALAARRAVLEPLALILLAHRDATPNTAGSNAANAGVEVTLNGSAAATHIEARASLDLDLAPISGEATLSAPDAATLLGQIGLAAPAGEALGRGELKVQAKPGSGGLAVNASLNAGQMSVTGDGIFSLGPGTEGHGGFSAVAPSASFAARLLGLSQGLRLDGDQRFDMAGGFNLTPEALSLDRLNGHLLGMALTGELRLALGGQRRLDGAIHAPILSVPGLAALALGPLRTNQGYWASARFPSFTPPPLPISLALTAPLVDLGAGLQGRDARLTLGLGEHGISLTQGHADIAGGSIGADWRIERDGGLARSQLRLSADGIDLKSLLPGGNLAGRMSGDLELLGAGETLSQIVASSGSGGSLRIADGRLEQADVNGLRRAFAKAVADEALMDKARLAALVAAETARAPLTGISFEAALVASGGVVKATIARQDLPTHQEAGQDPPPQGQTPPIQDGADAAAALDLKTLTLDARLGLSTVSPGHGEDRVPLAAALTWKGPLLAPKRDADAAALLQAVSVERLRLELERIELLQYDQREQGMFNRRLKAGRQKAIIPPAPEIAPLPPAAPASPQPAPAAAPKDPATRDPATKDPGASGDAPTAKEPVSPQPPARPPETPGPAAEKNVKPEPAAAAAQPERPPSTAPQAAPLPAPAALWPEKPAPAAATMPAPAAPAPAAAAPPLPPPIEVPPAPAIAGTPATPNRPIIGGGRPVILHPPD